MPVKLTKDGKNDYLTYKAIQFAFDLIAHNSLEDFQISNNDPRFGIFNNIIIETKGRSNNDNIYAVRLKHLTEGEEFSVKSLEAENGSFSILKFFENYLQCKSSYSFDNVRYIFYCNGDLNRCQENANDGQPCSNIKLLYKRENIPLVLEKHEEPLFDDNPLGGGSTAYKLRLGTSNEKSSELTDLTLFLQNFYLYVGQRDIAPTDYKNYEDFKKFYDNSIHESQIEGPFISFVESVRNEMKVLLNKKIFIIKLLDQLIDFRKENMIKSPTKGRSPKEREIQELLIEAFNTFDMTVTSKEDEIFYLKQQIVDNIGNIFTDDELRGKCIAYGLPMKDSSSIHKLLCYENQFPLIINKADKSIPFLLKIIDLCRSAQIRVVIINNLQEIESPMKVFRNLKDLLQQNYNLFSRLTDKCSIHVTDNRIVSLKHFLQDDEKLCSLITVDALLQMLFELSTNKNFTVLPEHCHYFSPSLMKRDNELIRKVRLVRQIIDTSFLTDTDQKFIAVIVCRAQVDHFAQELKEISLSAQQIYLYRDVFTEEDLKKITKKNPNIPHHLFDLVGINDKFYLEWKQSIGGVADLQDSQEHFLADEKMLTNLNKQINILCYDDEDEHFPLEVLKPVLDPNCYVFSADSRKQTVADVLSSLCQSEDLKCKPLLEILTERRRVIILWNNDEISEDNLDLIGRIRDLGFQQWICSNSSNRSRLEKHFSTLAWKIEYMKNGDPKLNIPKKRSVGQVNYQKPRWTLMKKGYEEIGRRMIISTEETGTNDEFEDLLLQAQASKDFIAEQGSSLLFKAVGNNQLEIIQLLIMQNIDVNSTDQNGDTPLLIAARKGYFEIVKFLTIYNANIDKTDKNGCTPLWLAASNGHLQIVEYLIDKNAIVNKNNNEGVSSPEIACTNEHKHVEKYLRIVLKQ